MKNKLLLIALIFCFGIIKSQNSYNESLRFIEVTGSAELEIEPDEISIVIGIQEYWKEEFEKRTKFKDYETKVSIAEIEKELLKNLSELGIPKEKIMIREVGNYWRYKGKEFLISKQFEIVLNDFKKVDEILNSINLKGVDYMEIGKLNNKNITKYRRQVKVEALKAAKEKADYLLESVDKHTGEIISIIELENKNIPSISQSTTSNSIMSVANNSGNDNFRKIKLRYEIKARFEIK